MERKTFFRAANDWELDPLSDHSSDQEFFASNPRLAARSTALIAKKRGAVAKADKAEAKQPVRQLWADITDDEDNFPSWAPKAPVARSEMDSENATDRLLWDPIGLGTFESSVADLLWDKTKLKKMDEGFEPTVLDKWSFSTAATESPSDNLDFQTDDDDLTPKAKPLPPATQPQVGQPNSPQQPQQPEQLQQGLQLLQTAAPQHQQVMMPLQQPMQPVQQPMQLPMQQPMMQHAMQQPSGMIFAVPYGMPMGMGMLPVVMSPTQRQGMVQPMPSIVATATEPDMSQPNADSPPMGMAHRFHQKNSSMGALSSDARTFTKKYNKGRLSIVSENKVHFQGTVHYSVQFTEGELCSADGVGFILSSDLPCTRNIQKIISIFANRTGRICIRVHDEVVRCSQRVKELEVGDWLEVNADLVNQAVSFTVWPHDNSAPSFATVSFKEVLEDARCRLNGVPRNPCGFLAVVIKHLGVSVKLGS
ncbi:unnamed protein product [Durusdinium trenchii]|uniref:Uncharacterized protein n=2 Tax=Durusdinium trenchii TaxID=1381693 RepID=A0ABP0RBD1_9DINO